MNTRIVEKNWVAQKITLSVQICPFCVIEIISRPESFDTFKLFAENNCDSSEIIHMP